MPVVQNVGGKLGIYVHVPFCRSKCAYCDFYSFAPGDDTIYERYVNALLSHMEYYKSAVSQRTPDSVYIGGGTPTALPEEQLLRLIRGVRHAFHLAKNTEFSVEVNPATVTYKTLVRMRRAGVNRISIGLQSAHAGELQALSRIHSRGEFEQCFRDARRAKIENISVDLMFGIPRQTQESLLGSVDYVTRLHPEHVSLYNLKIEPGTPFYKLRHQLPLPDEDMEFDMYRAACAMLEKRGYKQYEISNFARPGKMCKHNLKYWNCEEYLGLGPSAHSYFNGTRFSFVPNVQAYIKGIEHIQNDIGITVSSEEIKGKARMGEYIMLKFRLSDGLPLGEFQRTFGSDFLELYGAKLPFYLKKGYMVRRGDNIALTHAGMFVSNYILSDILTFEDLNAISPANQF
ncbi:MAG: radical SAM family heme chaperone HemW [Clostridiales bacterium]|jgi:oxygen-independent coproporphyrinogen-3 oxidase|nr:radical SAM family heme chaperone HemW [Clostridiales bacterium]